MYCLQYNYINVRLAGRAAVVMDRGHRALDGRELHHPAFGAYLAACGSEADPGQEQRAEYGLRLPGVPEQRGCREDTWQLQRPDAAKRFEALQDELGTAEQNLATALTELTALKSLILAAPTTTIIPIAVRGVCVRVRFGRDDH